LQEKLKYNKWGQLPGLNNRPDHLCPLKTNTKPFNELLINLVINFVNLENVYNKSECKN
jgi:hypothetical protein